MSVYKLSVDELSGLVAAHVSGELGTLPTAADRNVALAMYTKMKEELFRLDVAHNDLPDDPYEYAVNSPDMYGLLVGRLGVIHAIKELRATYSWLSLKQAKEVCDRAKAALTAASFTDRR